jgi:hypothetical protein
MKEVGPKRQLGVDSFNRELIRVISGGAINVVIESPDVVVGLGGGLNASVS